MFDNCSGRLASGIRTGIARALALEGGFSVLIPVAAARSPRELYRQAEELAGSAGKHYIGALTSMWAGIGAFLTGKWADATDSAGAP
jgi:hypothetical protein